ncbi:isopentenyl-diphosphate Delta-isomerase [Qingshengfaniella alkalisoli]|uniref:Isopentenyl-diphosphate Delta-isomerase n=1 Tax=Qingshengfaniella alkalisoli TaxID=2599296 RepID=A0A5B8IZL5_9RHOB|nr:isopentenyl-diphosphate Delta-isomerase [Qingshengfaniella alkalisoli]QDY70058.1 isopentenyl-diphosphate Delta-isomerase [Qingshengfaniella alkalisoli]
MNQLIPAWVDGELRPVEKLSVHRRGLKHKAVSVFVLDGDRVLVQRRAMSKYHTPGLWANTCCTHPKWGESSPDCAVRRLKEELGITDFYPALRGTVEYRADVGGGMIEHEVVDLFAGQAPGDLRIDPNPDEVMETAWMGIYDLMAEVVRHPRRYTPWIRVYLADYADSIFGQIKRD